MSTDKMREEFETWAKGIGRDVSRFDDGGYGEMDTESDWFVWQASRASLMIDLPQGGYFAGYDNEHMMESRDVREALETAGAKFK